MSTWLIRILVLLLVVASIGIAVVPLLVMLDLLQGGTGFGLCPGGIEGCDVPYTTPFEFLLVLTLAMFLVVLAIRLVVRLSRRLWADSYAIKEPGPRQVDSNS